MTVGLSILFAAVVGGIAFMLIDRWERRSAPSASAPEPAREIWTPSTRPATTSSLFIPPSANVPAPFREHYEERTELPPSRKLWDDPPPRSDEDDDDHRPPGLWSGWAR